uniref:Uncharacterized protein n=1 Tax=Vespula pensylvanica TaxID=30213 RepID=A0A834NQF3_VESPE|nr:hypothetical protein H0235_012233 [Vespula pensylvanica]
MKTGVIVKVDKTLTMLKGSTNISRWLLLTGLLCSVACQSVPSSSENKTAETGTLGNSIERPRTFSLPRDLFSRCDGRGWWRELKNDLSLAFRCSPAKES